MTRNIAFKWTFSLLLWIFNLTPSYCQTICSTERFGPDANTPKSTYDANVNEVQFLFSYGHQFTCHGVVSQWRFRSARLLGGACYTMTVQIWRPFSTGTYILIGENTLFDDTYCTANLISSNQDRTIFIDIQPSERIPVQPDDVIAWKDSNNVWARKIGYNPLVTLPGSAPTIVTIRQPACTSGVGKPCDWSRQNVVAKDYGLEAHVDPAKIPVFINLPRMTSTLELQKVGTFVYQVETSNNFNWNPVVLPNLTYSIVYDALTTCNSSWFAIDKDRGNVSVAAFFDLASVATVDPYSCKLSIEVKQQDGLLDTSILTINIMNVNEPPVINNLPSTIHYDVMGFQSLIYIVNAIDPDIPVFQTSLNYMIVSVEPFSSVFSIVPVNSTAAEIRILSLLDDWTGSDEFEINVTVSDMQLVDGPKTLTVILDNMVHSPVIKNLNATIFLAEYSWPPSPVYIVQSVVDAMRVGSPTYDIQYSIIKELAGVGVPTKYFDYVNDPNKDTGDIVLNAQLDYLKYQNYTLEIQAIQTYRGSTLYSEPRFLTVYVTWVDQRPANPSISPNSILLPEDTPIGSTVPVTITVTDRDVDNNLMGDYLQYFVSDPYFIVDNTTKIMSTTASLFIRSGSCTEEHLSTVYVRDAFGKTSQSTVNVTVTRNNRAAPEFNQTQYSGSISEAGIGGSPTGIQVFASDPDCGSNGTVRYFILEDLANEYFQIDTTSGTITQKQPISQPTYPNMTFTIMAADGGVPSLNTTAVVFIEVSAVNAHAPWFASDYIEIETRSDAYIGSTIYTLNVTDPDSASVNDIGYEFVIVQDDFDVKSSGAVVTKRSLKSFKRYTLHVIATDTGQGKNYFTDPAVLVVDTYKATRQLIDIKMLRPLSETDPKIQDFMTKINNFLKPWVVKMEDLKYDGDDTVVTIYAYKGTSTFSVEPSTKEFIDRDALLDKMRTDIYGTPVDALRGTEFEDYEVASVHPTYPVWVLDTPEGIATLTIVCLVALALVIGVIVGLLKCFNLACFKKTKVAPEPEPLGPTKTSSGDEFPLGYKTGEPYNARRTDATVSDVEPFERPPTYHSGSSPPIRPDAELQFD